jgi:hypothetical protein
MGIPIGSHYGLRRAQVLQAERLKIIAAVELFERTYNPPLRGSERNNEIPCGFLL